MACSQGKYSNSKTAMTSRHQHDAIRQHDHRGLYCLKHVGYDHTGFRATQHNCPRALHTINAEHSVAVLTGKTTNVLRVDWSTEKR